LAIFCARMSVGTGKKITPSARRLVELRGVVQ
jgi:hypothetical protein